MHVSGGNPLDITMHVMKSLSRGGDRSRSISQKEMSWAEVLCHGPHPWDETFLAEVLDNWESLDQVVVNRTTKSVRLNTECFPTQCRE